MSENVKEPDGAVDAWMSKVFGRSWRTSLVGVLAIACGLVPLIPGVPPQVVDFVKDAGPIVVGGGLLAAKDKAVSGLNRK